MENCTDLAVESYENGGKTVLDGVKVEENGKITTVTVFNEKGGTGTRQGSREIYNLLQRCID